MPSTADGINRPNGFEVSMMNSRKPTEIQPSMASTLALKMTGSRLLNSTTAAVHSASISSHSSNEPSWALHTAE